MPGKQVVIPATIDKAGERLVALDSLATATGWERAAIVYAFTYDGVTKEGKARKKAAEDCSTAIFTVTEFIGQRFVGLVSAHTVKHYRKNWQLAIDAGKATEILPGDKIKLPDMPWPIEDTNVGSRVSADPQKAIQQVVAQHGTKSTAEALAEAAPQVVVRAVEESRPVQEELDRRRSVRDEAHRQSVEDQIRPLRGVADELKAEYQKTATGTDEPAAQDVIHVNEALLEAKVTWVLEGAKKSADLVSALSNLEAAAHAWRLAVTGESKVMLTDDDLAWAEELGIDMGAQ